MENGLFINLDFEDAINLLTSVGPDYKQMNYFISKGFGKYIGGHVERWSWNYNAIRKLDIEEVYNLYLAIKYNKKLTVD